MSGAHEPPAGRRFPVSLATCVAYFCGFFRDCDLFKYLWEPRSYMARRLRGTAYAKPATDSLRSFRAWLSRARPAVAIAITAADCLAAVYSNRPICAILRIGLSYYDPPQVRLQAAMYVSQACVLAYTFSRAVFFAPFVTR